MKSGWMQAYPSCTVASRVTTRSAMLVSSSRDTTQKGGRATGKRATGCQPKTNKTYQTSPYRNSPKTCIFHSFLRGLDWRQPFHPFERPLLQLSPGQQAPSMVLNGVVSNIPKEETMPLLLTLFALVPALPPCQMLHWVPFKIYTAALLNFPKIWLMPRRKWCSCKSQTTLVVGSSKHAWTRTLLQVALQNTDHLLSNTTHIKIATGTPFRNCPPSHSPPKLKKRQVHSHQPLCKTFYMLKEHCHQPFLHLKAQPRNQPLFPLQPLLESSWDASLPQVESLLQFFGIVSTPNTLPKLLSRSNPISQHRKFKLSKAKSPCKSTSILS